VRLGTLLYFYGRRLRTHPIQELLAGAGIAIGVALVFAVVVANESIGGSTGQIVHGIAGSARLQLSARDDRGVTASLLARVRALPGVTHASGLLEQRVSIDGPGGRGSADLVGVDGSLASLDGPLTRGFNPAAALLLRDGVVLPSALADAIGLPSSAGVQRQVLIHVRGRSAPTHVAAVLGSELIGPLAATSTAIAPLPYVQRIAGLPHRVTRILVATRPDREAAVQRGLEQLTGGRVAVASVDEETRLLNQASAPNRQATSVFAVIAGLVGVLLAFNAMLLTVPERRRSVAGLRLLGFTPRQVVALLGFQAVALGVIASTAGMLAGDVLARTVFDTVPSYLTFAFAVGAGRTITPLTVVLVFAGGVAATCLAAAQPLLDLRRGHPVDGVYRQHGEPGQALSAHMRTRLALAGLLLLAGTTFVLVLMPSATVVGIAALALAVLLGMPVLLALVLRGTGWLAERTRSNMLVVAVMALRATTLRAIGLAAIGAVAVFGSIAIEGTHTDLVRGLDRNFAEYLGTADLWITAGGTENSLTTESFDARVATRRVRDVPGVEAVRPYYGGLLDISGRRIWVVARSPADRTMLPPSQLVDGDLATATARLRRGGWIALSEQLARSRHVGIGDATTLPTPSGLRSFRVAATVTNLGWGPGAVVLSAADYVRAWGTHDPTALEVDVRPEINPRAIRATLQRALGTTGGLRVQTTAERGAQFRALAHQGLERLSEISTLLLVAAALALGAGTAAAIWQRRRSLAAYRLQGFLPWQLWRALLLEAAVVLGAGCGVGAIAGLYGHALAGRWLRLATGFPAPFATSGWQTGETLALVAGTAIAMIALPSWFAAQVPARVGLQE
jgi:putative ABC transport system permease protein